MASAEDAARGTRKVPSTCQGCLTNCSIVVTADDGRIVHVAGNPASAATHGAVCPNVRIAMQQQADGDRVLHPLRRKNPKKGRWEDPQFERVSWDEALDEVADRLDYFTDFATPFHAALIRRSMEG